MEIEQGKFAQSKKMLGLLDQCIVSIELNDTRLQNQLKQLSQLAYQSISANQIIAFRLIERIKYVETKSKSKNKRKDFNWLTDLRIYLLQKVKDSLRDYSHIKARYESE